MFHKIVNCTSIINGKCIHINMYNLCALCFAPVISSEPWTLKVFFSGYQLTWLIFQSKKLIFIALLMCPMNDKFFKVGQKDLADWVPADTVNPEPDKLTFDLWPFTQNPVNHQQHAFQLIYNWIPTSVSMLSSLPLIKTIYRVWGQ